MSEPRRPVCGERVRLPGHLVPAAVDLAAGAAAPEDVERALRCVLERHPTGDHHAFVAERTPTGAVWTHWTRGREPAVLTALDDCPVIGPDPAREPCCEYDQHPGGHTWQLGT